MVFINIIVLAPSVNLTQHGQGHCLCHYKHCWLGQWTHCNVANAEIGFLYQIDHDYMQVNMIYHNYQSILRPLIV